MSDHNINVQQETIDALIEGGEGPGPKVYFTTDGHLNLGYGYDMYEQEAVGWGALSHPTAFRIPCQTRFDHAGVRNKFPNRLPADTKSPSCRRTLILTPIIPTLNNHSAGLQKIKPPTFVTRASAILSSSPR